WGMPLNVAYKYFGGTSMSNPLAGGAAVVVRDFYQKTYGLGASAALVKATLINSAVDLLDENNDGVNDNFYPIPNVHEGWGRINLAAAVDGSHQFVEQTTGLGTNGVATYQYSVAGGAAFKVSLVWSDYASTETANKNLVNDLDLVVTSPSGQVYRGNVFAGGWSQANSGTADRTNNVENVYVPAAEAGVWTVTVSGFNVPFGPQPFALVVDGLGGPPPPTPTPTSTATPTATPTPTSPPAGSVHIGDLDGSTTTAKGNRWNASVTVTVHSDSEAPVSGATVSGSWSGAASGGGSCTTNASGVCVIEKNNLRGSSATFTVTSVSATQPYNAAANHDPDGDSNGTSITIVAP
ncbi:MAG: hypothetical protein H3C34_28685, partial [Caldilineaceae bacterium]|nr:hypothetical protein [Caldilineaceae bacterium]